MLNEAPRDQVNLAWLLGRLQRRSFGLIMLLLALVGLVPGAGIFIGILLAFPAVQMILGRESPTLPRFLASRSIATRHIARLVARTIPLLNRVEALIRPRWPTPFQGTKRLIGFVVLLLLAATLIWPFPFSQIIPALVIMLISFAYLGFPSRRQPFKSGRPDREAMDGDLGRLPLRHCKVRPQK